MSKPDNNSEKPTIVTEAQSNEADAKIAIFMLGFVLRGGKATKDDIELWSQSQSYAVRERVREHLKSIEKARRKTRS